MIASFRHVVTIALIVFCVVDRVDAQPTQAPIERNGLRIDFDGESGQITSMSSTVLGSILQAAPIEGPLRIRWTVLPESATEPGSVVVQATVTTSAPVKYFLFPHFRGLRVLGGQPEEMELRMALGVIQPFTGEYFQKEYAGDMYQMYALRWLDFGNLRRGLSVFQKQWQQEEISVDGGSRAPRPSLHVSRSERNGLEIAWVNHIALAPGQVWRSAPFVLTPHRGGWANGIQPYRRYVTAARPSIVVPDHIKADAAVRMAWMVEGPQPSMPDFTYRDLTDPARGPDDLENRRDIAGDALSHGIHEVILWGAISSGATILNNPVHLPADWRLREPTATYLQGVAELGGKLTDARSRLGVNFAPFLNVQGPNDCKWSNPEYTSEYAFPGLPPSSNQKNPPLQPTAAKGYQFGFNLWRYHSRFLPAIDLPIVIPADMQRPAHQSFCDQYNQAKLRAALIGWARSGMRSVCMDVYTDAGTTEGLSETISAFRNVVRSELRDSMATMCGEPVEMNLERTVNRLDYIKGWLDYIEQGAYISAVKYPRIAMNVSHSPRVVKMAFADGALLNAMPKQPDRPNGSGLLSDSPISSSLKQVSALRKQFANYFIDGTFIGESVLSEPIRPVWVRRSKANYIGGATIDRGDFEYPDVFIKAHQLPDRLLIVVLNTRDTNQSISFSSILDMWLPSRRSYTVREYNSGGRQLGADQTIDYAPGTAHTFAPRVLRSLELRLFEVIADPS